jgi:hypothetical protein
MGHANLNTTNRYAKMDLEMKRKAIALGKPVPRQSRTPWSKDPTVLDWLSLFRPSEMWSWKYRRPPFVRHWRANSTFLTTSHLYENVELHILVRRGIGISQRLSASGTTPTGH